MDQRINSSVKDEELVKKRLSQLQKGAVNLFKQKGFHRATTREIAKAAGFSIGTLYEYIRKKEDVLFLVCDTIHDEVKIRMERVTDQESTSEEALKQAVTAYFQIMDEMQDEVLILYQELKALPKKEQEYVLKKEREMVGILERVIQNSYPDVLDQKELSLVANNIYVQGQMWGFRRWLIQKEFSLKEYTKQQFELLKGQMAYKAKQKSGGGV